MYAIDLEGKNAFVFGVANQRSIAWHIASALDQAGARVALSYLNDRIRPGVERLASGLSSGAPLIACDVSDDSSVENAFETARAEMGRPRHNRSLGSVRQQGRSRWAIHRYPS